MFILKNGECSYVLPKHNDLSYINVKEGQYFGILDVVGSCVKKGDYEYENFY